MAKAPSFASLRVQPYPFKTQVSVFNVVSDFLAKACRQKDTEKNKWAGVKSLSPAVTLSTMLLAEEINYINIRIDHFANCPLRVVF